MSSTTNLQSHLKWLEETPYSQQSSRFGYGIDLKRAFAEKPIEFERYGENIKTPPKELRNQIRDRNSSPSVHVSTQRKRIGKIEYGIESYTVTPSQQQRSEATSAARSSTQPAFQLPPQRRVSPSPPVAPEPAPTPASNAISGGGHRLHIKRKRDSSQTTVATIDLTEDEDDLGVAPPKKVLKDFTEADISSHHSSLHHNTNNDQMQDDNDFAAELDDLMGDDDTTSIPGAPLNKPNTSNTGKKKKLIFNMPSQRQRPVTPPPPLIDNDSPTHNAMPPPQCFTSNTTTSVRNIPPSSPPKRALPPAIQSKITAAASIPARQHEQPSSPPTSESHPQQKTTNLDVSSIIMHLTEEKNLQDTFFDHISDMVKEIKTLALTVPNAKPLLTKLFAVRNDMESKMFDVSVGREKITGELREAQSNGGGSVAISRAPSSSSHTNYSFQPQQSNVFNSNTTTRDNNYNHYNEPPPMYNDGMMDQSDNNGDGFQNPNDGYSNCTRDNHSANDSLRGGSNFADLASHQANFPSYENNAHDDWRNASEQPSQYPSLNFSNYTPSTVAQRDNVNPRIYKERNFSWSQQIERQLKNKFAIHTGFRSLQLDAINATMDGRDVFVVMPTGGGKSLTYQLPASISCTGVTVVVSPLLSLIQDQLQEMQQLGVSTTFLSGEGQWDDQLNTYRELESPSPPYRLLYVTPEKVSQSNSFQNVLIRMDKNGTLDRFVIDEAHCISKWGNHFRQDYRNLSQLKEKFPHIPVLALTATATDQVQEDIIQQLRITNCVKLKSSFNRDNLVYTVRKKTSAVVEDVVNFLRTHRLKNSSGIVYCLSKKDCENVAEALCENGLNAAVYHADHVNKKENHEAWKRGSVNIIVATIAFGMGINKPDVRFVIHHSMPKTIEDYYQESGRAGRDGLESHCLLFYSKKDVNRLVRLVAGSGMQQNQYDFSKVDFPGLNAIMDYCLCECECRRVLLLNHFGETDFDKKDCKEKCDICKHGVTRFDQDVTEEAVNVLQIIQEVRNTTETNLIKYARDQKMGKGGFFKESDKLKTLKGSCKKVPKTLLETIVRYLTLRGYLVQEGRASKGNNIFEILLLGPRADELLTQHQRFTIPVASNEGSRKRKFTSLFRQAAPVEEDAEYKAKLERLTQELYVMRTKLSHENQLPPYLVTGQVTLDDMAKKMPKTVEELKGVELFAKEKIRNYGIPYLRVIRQFCADTFHNCTPLKDDEIEQMEREIDALFQDEEPAVQIVTPRKPTVVDVDAAEEDGELHDDDLMAFLEENGL